MECSAVVTVGVFHEVFSSSTVGVGVSPHRVFHEVFSSSTVGVGVSSPTGCFMKCSL